MFSKLQTYKKFSNEIITIQELQVIVKNNPQKEYIEYIRGLEYKSTEYNNSKSKISCIMPHGIFNGLGNANFVSFSNFLYYDIDGIDTKQELNDTIKRLNDTFPISFLQRSLSDKGFHFLIKLDDTFLQPNDTFYFNEVYCYVRQLLIDKGFNIDLSANGLSRKMLLSSDNDCLFNDKVSLSIDKVSLNNFIELRNVNGKVKIKSKLIKNKSITPNDTFFELIPFNELTTQIDIKTKYVKEIEGDYIIEDMEFYHIIIPERIYDGNKHKLYTRIVNALYFINNNITKQQVLSYLFYINNRAMPPMNNKYLFNFISRLCNYIEETGEIKIKPRIKKLHFNENSNLTKKQKQIMGAKLNGKLRTNKTREIIQNAKYELAIRNKKITQKEVSEYTGLSIATVKRNWKLEKEEIKIEIPIIEEQKNEPILEVMDEDNFFDTQTIKQSEKVVNNEDMRVIEYRYKNFKEVKLEITQKDKEDFRLAINRLQKGGFEICLSTLELCGLDKYKLDYLYNIWCRKNVNI